MADTEPSNHWRVGRTVGRTVYRQRFDDPSKADELIGLMDTQGLAEFVCRCVNYCLDHGIDPGLLPDDASHDGDTGAEAVREAMGGLT